MDKKWKYDAKRQNCKGQGNGNFAPPGFVHSVWRRLLNFLSLVNVASAIFITRIPKRDSSLATGKIMATIPSLEAEYAAWPICPSKAATEAVVMMTPRSPLVPGSLCCMAAAARRTILKVPTPFYLAGGGGPPGLFKIRLSAG